MALQSRSDIKYENKAYSVTGQELLSCGQAAEIISKKLVRTTSYINILKPDARKVMMKTGTKDWLIDAIWSCIIPLDQIVHLKQLVQLSQYFFHNLQRKNDVLPLE